MDRSDRDVVCGRCWARLPVLPAPRCQRCGHPQSHVHGACDWCALLPPFVRAARSVCWAVQGPGLDIVHALKYGGWRCAAAGMAERMARLAWPPDVLAEHPIMVPVPLSPQRERERGYNQSRCLGEELAARWGTSCRSDVLARTRRTRTQTRLTPEDRLRNVSGAFSTPESARIVLRGAHVVLVDDVVTTAATLNACAAALYASGARIISYVTFARAPAAGDRCDWRR